MKKRVPCIIVDNSVTSWSAATNWQLNNIKQQYGNSLFECGASTSNDFREIMSLRKYLNYCKSEHPPDQEIMYLFDSTFESDCPQLVSDYLPFTLSAKEAISELPKHCRPNYRWFLVGPRFSGSAMHKDPIFTHAWNTLIVGKKKWVLVSPSLAKAVLAPPSFSEGESDCIENMLRDVLRSSDYDMNSKHDSPDTTNTVRGWFKKLENILVNLPVNRSGTYEGGSRVRIKDDNANNDRTSKNCDDAKLMVLFDQLPFETVYVPSGWFHAVLNTEISIAVTHNFIPENNFSCMKEVDEVVAALELAKKSEADDDDDRWTEDDSKQCRDILLKYLNSDSYSVERTT